jgi:hypothetical protein
VPHSVFTGRPLPGPGEPLFLPEDTDLAVALALEERDACPKCGLPKAWCRDNDAGRARFDVAEDFCWATYRVALRQEKQTKEKVPQSTQMATVMRAAIRPGYEPDIQADLPITEEA